MPATPIPVPPEPRPLPELLPPGARGFAVVDLETTGTGQLCRIVEIALVFLAPDGELQQERTTLINPGVPIPNAAVHGIDDALAATAPAFADVAPELARLLDGRVLVAHNLHRFDGPILRQHFWEAGSLHPDLVTISTARTADKAAIKARIKAAIAAATAGLCKEEAAAMAFSLAASAVPGARLLKRRHWSIH